MIYVRTFKYRLRPTKRQRNLILQTLELCRWVYNETLAVRKNAWEQDKVTITRYETFEMIPRWKEQKPELYQVHSQVLRDACTRVDLAFKAFFRRVKSGEKPGYPRFRGYGRYDSFTFTQGGFDLVEDGLLLSKIGRVKIVLHRPIEGKVKTLTIRRDTVGNWYACLTCEVEPEPLPFNDLAVGVDMGLESFATLSNGVQVENARFFRRDENELAKAHRKLSKAEKGSPERAKRLRVIQHIHQRITNRRKDFAHKLSHDLVDGFGFIAFENLNISGLLQNHHIAKSISDVAWSQLITYTTYKAENAGRVVVLVDPRNTSKMCSGCGTLVEKSLAVRVHNCPNCGLVMDRDQNAAVNILGLGLQSLGQSREAPAFGRWE